MAREFAKVKAAIWQDDDFRDLPPPAQHLYFVILTDPDLSYCGVADWRPRRIIPKSAGWTLEQLYESAQTLTEQLLLVIDPDTEEVLVRSFLRHDGVMQHNKLCISAMNAYGSVASNTLRGVIVHELRRLEKEFPEWPAWGREQVREVLKRRAVDPLSAPPLAPGVGAGLAPGVAPRLATGLGPTPAPGLASGLQQQQQQQHTTATKKLSPRSRPKRQLPDDWQPNDKHRATAQEKNLDINYEAEAFRNHAHSVDRRAANWNAAFSNWLLKATPRPQQRPLMATGTERMTAGLQIAAQYEAMEGDQARAQIGNSETAF